MLTKETKQKAEKMAQELAPLFATAHKLGDILQKARNTTSKAHRVATAWQYPDSKGFAEDAGENWETIKSIKEKDSKEWHEKLNEKYLILSQCETAEKVASLNYRNYIAYICELISYLLHDGDTWAQFYNKKGLESLTDYLNTAMKRSPTDRRYIYISKDGTGWEAFGSPCFYCYLKVHFWGVCCVDAESWGTFSEIKKGEKIREYNKPEEPKRYTLAQYIKIVKDLKKLENEAKDKARQHHEKARRTGIIYFEGGLTDPHLETWGKRY